MLSSTCKFPSISSSSICEEDSLVSFEVREVAIGAAIAVAEEAASVSIASGVSLSCHCAVDMVDEM